MTTHSDNDKILVKYTEAANLLSVSRTTVFRLVKSGDLTAVKLGGSARITMESVRALGGSINEATAAALAGTAKAETTDAKAQGAAA